LECASITDGWARRRDFDMADKPRSFDELVAAEDPAARERRERGDTFKDAGVENDFHADVNVQEDREHPGEWLVEYFDEDPCRPVYPSIRQVLCSAWKTQS